MPADIELNQYKIDADEPCVGRAHPGGLPDTLNRMPSEIWNRMRAFTVFADGSSKLRFIGEIFDTTADMTTSTSYHTLREKGITITEDSAVIFFSFCGDFEAWDDDHYTLAGLRVKVDDNVIDSDDIFIISTGGDLRSGALYDRQFMSELIGAGLHTVSMEWKTQSGSSFGVDSNLIFNAIVFESNPKE